MKTTILDTCPRISIYQLIRLGAFKKNSTFHFQDSINALSYTITTDVSGNSPIINIDLKATAGVVHQSVRVHAAPSHLGNHQVLRLICPFTGTRCCILHLYKYYFMHRSTFKSTYASRTICPSRRHIAHTIRTIYTGQKYLWLATRPYLRISYRGQPTRTFHRLQRFALRHANRLFTFPTPKTKTLSKISTVLRSRTLPSTLFLRSQSRTVPPHSALKRSACALQKPSCFENGGSRWLCARARFFEVPFFWFFFAAAQKRTYATTLNKTH